MTAQHMELLVEEPSMEAFLRELLPRIIPADRTFNIHAFQGKPDLLGKLESRLRGYAHWLPDDWRLIVVVDRDEDECRQLKRRMEAMAATAGLKSRSQAQGHRWQIVNRIAVEELEAWYFGDWEAVRSVYPRVSPHVPNKQGFRDPDAVAGGTWEAFERVLKQCGYFQTGLRKVEAARALGARIDPQRNRSRSFMRFHEAVVEAMA